MVDLTISKEEACEVLNWKIHKIVEYQTLCEKLKAEEKEQLSQLAVTIFDSVPISVDSIHFCNYNEFMAFSRILNSPVATESNGGSYKRFCFKYKGYDVICLVYGER